MYFFEFHITHFVHIGFLKLYQSSYSTGVIILIMLLETVLMAKISICINPPPDHRVARTSCVVFFLCRTMQIQKKEKKRLTSNDICLVYCSVSHEDNVIFKNKKRKIADYQIRADIHICSMHCILNHNRELIIGASVMFKQILVMQKSLHFVCSNSKTSISISEHP